MSSPLPSWHVDVEGCTNFRDAGGWPLVDGGRMRTGLLYRSDGPLRVSDAGRRTIESLGVELAIDLRQHSQTVRTAGFLPPEQTEHVPLVDRLIDTGAPPPLDDPADFTDLYDAMLVTSRDLLARAVDLVADGLTRSPVLVHCSYGKDRAGLLVALIQAAIGVEATSIVDDYARSDEPCRRRHDWMLREPWPGDVDLATMPVSLFRAHGDSMRILLDRQIERHGSLDAWAATFPLGERTVKRLRRTLTDDQTG